ncbi:MAG: hypothetical protein ABI594_16730 [Ginsengibacter sp.]
MQKIIAIIVCWCWFITASAQPNITRVEYFIDTDPGFGKATSITINTPSNNISNGTFNVSIGSLSTGIHALFIRSRDANGKWSVTNSRFFYKPASSGGGPLPNITRVEYFIDNDPGFGNAINIPVTAGSNLQNISFTASISTLTTGIHALFIRSRDANGKWSVTNNRFFYKPDSTLSGTPPNITNVEYFIDTDPGFGKGTPIAIDSSTNLANFMVPVNISGLSVGNHIFFIRSRSATGYSITNAYTFPIAAVAAAPYINVNSFIVKASNCARDSFDISYDARGTYNSGNVFTVQLSDAAGSFTSPTAIGSYAGTKNTIIKAKLPSHLPDGSGYKVRVISSNPVVTGITNATTITIHDRPVAQTITGASDANTTFSYSYSVPSFTGSIWLWLAPAATITQTNNSANLLWNTQGQPQTIKVIETNQFGCVGDTSFKNVNVYNLSISNVVASSLAPCPADAMTVTGSATGVYSAGNIFTAQLSNASGSFASPVNIGSVTANPIGLSQAVSINATLPYPLANGAGYRVRIVANSPAVTGTDNGQNIVVNKPNLGVDQTLSKCPGFMADISAVFNTTGLTIQWNTATPSAVDVGTYQLIVTNANGCKDTANVAVTDYPKPNLGADQSTTISCANGTADITTLYNTSSYSSVVYSAATPATAIPGAYTLIVTNANGCKDTANITVLDASTATVPSAGSNSKTANRECTDAQGWTHYYYDNGTPTDYSDDIRLLSLKKNGNNIGTVGNGTFVLTVAATSGAGGNHAVKVNSPLVLAGTNFFSMNRYWNITPTTQPTSSVGVRFYYNSQDLADVNGDDPQGPKSHTELTLYKLQGGNPDPTTNWTGATGVTYYASGGASTLSNWVYTDLGNNTHQAEFLVSDFSGGGAGALNMSALPVTYLSFTATAQKDKVVLQWSTATELNSKDFSIQRSLDGIYFETIATVRAAGNSNTIRYYQFDDLQSISFKGEVVFFRVVESDINERLIYSSIKNVKIAEGINTFTLRYNPVSSQAELNYASIETGEAQIRVVDHLGRVMMIKQLQIVTGDNKIILKTGSLAKGIYEIELTGKKYHGHVRMVKQ